MSSRCACTTGRRLDDRRTPGDPDVGLCVAAPFEARAVDDLAGRRGIVLGIRQRRGRSAFRPTAGESRCRCGSTRACVRGSRLVTPHFFRMRSPPRSGPSMPRTSKARDPAEVWEGRRHPAWVRAGSERSRENGSSASTAPSRRRPNKPPSIPSWDHRRPPGQEALGTLRMRGIAPCSAAMRPDRGGRPPAACSSIPSIVAFRLGPPCSLDYI